MNQFAKSGRTNYIGILLVIVLAIFSLSVIQSAKAQPDLLPTELADRQNQTANLIQDCAGSANGTYDLTGNILAGHTNNYGWDMDVRHGVGGTLALMTAMANGECDSARVQADGVVLAINRGESVINSMSMVGPLYGEPVWALASRENNDVDDLKKINKTKFTIGIVGKNSGSSVTWANFIIKDRSYEKTNVIYVDDVDTAIGKLGQLNGIDVLLMVAGAGTLVPIAEQYGDSIYLIPATDKNFDDLKSSRGDKVFNKITIDKNTPGLEALLTPPNKRSPQNLQTVVVQAYLLMRDDLPSDAKNALRESVRLSEEMFNTLNADR